MREYKFKSGDRVKVIELNKKYHDKDTIEIGMLGTVIEDESNRPWVEFDEDINGNHTFNGSERNKTMCMWDYEIEKIKEIKMKKSDLKTGDKCTLKNGRVIYYNEDCLYGFNNLTDDFKYGINDSVSIVKIERPIQYEILFERQDKKEMTISEIEKELGYSIKIVKED